jgi:hypothetical protein
VSTRPLRIRREDLYARVWTTPLRKLAKEFGISDVGLAKVCRRHSIPLPGLGYWARVQFGKNPGRTPLPALEQLGAAMIEIAVRPVHDMQELAVLAEPVTVPVSDDQPITHPFAIRTQRMLAHGRKDERDVLFPKQGRASHVQVSKAALPRALRILDALLRAMDEREHPLSWPKDLDARLTVAVLGENLLFTISEGVEQKAQDPTEQEPARQIPSPWYTSQRRDYQPTGHLRLTIEGVPYGIRHTWGDATKQRVEQCLGKFIATLPHVAQAIKKEREEHERRHRKWEEERKREEECRQRREEYKRKAELTKKLASAWHDAKLIREFAIAFARASAQLSKTEAGRPQAESFFVWVMEYADTLDPLSAIPAILTEFRRPPQKYGF